MRSVFKSVLLVAGAWWGFAAGAATAQNFGVKPPDTTPQSKTAALKGWIIVIYDKQVPASQRTVKWVLINDAGEEKAKAVGAGNPNEKKKGDYGIRFSRKGAANKNVDFALDPKQQVVVVVTKS